MDGPSTSALTLPDDVILRADSVADLCQKLCLSVVETGYVMEAAILLAESGLPLHYAAGAGQSVPGFAQYAFPAADSAPDLASAAFAESRLCLAENLAQTRLTASWRQAGIGKEAGAAAAVPLLSSAAPAGVFLFFLTDPGEIPSATLAFLERLSANAAFRLNALRREAAQDRLTCMVKTLSASTDAILRAETRNKLFALVCEAARQGGQFAGIVIALKEAASDSLEIVACADSTPDHAPTTQALTAAGFGKTGLAGLAFQSGQPAFSNDDPAEAQLVPFAARAGAALPLLSDGKPIGVIMFAAAERGTFTPGLVELLQRLAANLVFALENFDREEARAKAEARIEYLATHDSLTNLPNRAMFIRLLEFSIQAAGQHQRQGAVLLINLDRFKLVNDSLGGAAGDALLIEMGNRLRRSVRAGDIVARLGGDEFMILLSEMSGSDAIAAIANNLLTTISQPLTLNAHECRVTASIGIAKFPDDAIDGNLLVKYADLAMHLAKSEGKNDVRFFSAHQQANGINRLLVESGLGRALEAQEFSLQYQPKLDVITHKIAGVEALLRWTHPELGPVPPSDFLPVAEATGLIIPIGRWVLATACAQAMAWQQSGLPAFSMAVNVSARQFFDENLLRDIDAALAVTGLPPNLLQIEITESVVMLNAERAIALLDAIQSRGVRLAIDDFGTGYSSMSALKRFPIDTIKIDRSFVRDLPRNAEDKAVARAIINMGKALGLTIVAEGVETLEQDEFLRNHLCDEIQGFLFGKPVPPERIGEFI